MGGRHSMSKGSEVGWHLRCSEDSGSLMVQEQSPHAEQSQEITLGDSGGGEKEGSWGSCPELFDFISWAAVNLSMNSSGVSVCWGLSCRKMAKGSWAGEGGSGSIRGG